MISNNNKRAIVLVLLGIVAITLTYVSVKISNRYLPKPYDPLANYRPKATNKAKPSDPQTPENSTRITPLATPQTSLSKKLTISSPKQGSTITNNAHFSGEASGYTGSVYYRLKTKSSGVIANGQINLPNQTTAPQNFSFDITFDASKEIVANDSGDFSIYTISPDNGAESNIASVAVYVQ